jgi:hypothetical protein
MSQTPVDANVPDAADDTFNQPAMTYRELMENTDHPNSALAARTLENKFWFYSEIAFISKYYLEAIEA